MFWPSFNSAITAHGDDQHRTALNTYYSLAACTLATYGMSAITSHDGKLDMVRLPGHLVKILNVSTVKKKSENFCQNDS